MRAPHAWFSFVVIAALAAGMLAFLVSTPDQGRRIERTETGFTRLGTASVFGSFGHAAEYHRAAHAAAIGARAATGVARSWLASVPSGGPATGPALVVSEARGGDPEARRVAAFIAWGDGLPARRWKVTTSAPIPVVGVQRTWTVAAEVELGVAQSVTRTRTQVIELELELRGSAALRRGVPRAWVVADVVVTGGPRWLRGYRDPIVVGSKVVDVVAPAAHAVIAQAAATTATEALSSIAARYAPDTKVLVLGIWMVDRAGAARTVTGRGAPATVRTASDDDPHALAWADQRGDVVVDLSQFADATGAGRSAAIRHAVTDLLMRSSTTRVPAILADGIVDAEARRVGGEVPLTLAELKQLDTSFFTRTSGIADMLVAPASAELDDGVPELAAIATMAWLLEVRGAPRTRALVHAIQGGVAPATSLRRTIGLAPRGVERQVAAWIRAQLPVPATPPPRVLDEVLVDEPILDDEPPLPE